MLQRVFLVFMGFLPLLLFSSTYTYTMSWENPGNHTYHIELETAPETYSASIFSMPAWRPGRYYLQDYAAAVSHFEAFDGAGNPLPWKKVDKDSWKVTHDPLQKIVIRYRVYANNQDAGSSYLGPGQAYFNPVNLFMYIPGRLNDPVSLKVKSLPSTWKIATALDKGKLPNHFRAKTYHEFVDSPTVLAEEIKTLEFEDQGTRFFLHFQGPYQGDEEVDQVVVENVKKICQEQVSIFGGKYPFDQFHFVYRLLPFRYRHAVEHARSASFALPAGVTASPQALNGLYGITAHEFWHAWNVKRIRPLALWPYDYSQPQYTRLHWFTEGVTDYYTLLTLYRTGLTSKENFYRRLARSIESIDNNYAASVVSASEASFNSWLSTSPYAVPQHRISYYSMGSRLGFLLDMEMRKRSKGEVGLDQLFTYLYEQYFLQDKGVYEDGIEDAAEKLTGTDWKAWFDSYVHGTTPYPYDLSLEAMGLQLEQEEDPEVGARRIGILESQYNPQGLLINSLHPAGDAARAGLQAEDLILSINGEDASRAELEKLFRELKRGDKLKIERFRNGTRKTLSLDFQGAHAPVVYYLKEDPKAKKKAQQWREAWLGEGAGE
jgi:predicted metalloprotease with PDZ domain